MPKLDSKTASSVEETEATHGGDFEPLAPGKYLARLVDVEVRDEKNKYDALQWSAEFDNIHTFDESGPGEKQPGRQWLNLTLPTTAKPHSAYTNGPEKWEKYQNMLRGRLAAFFEAFGFTPDSDTDEMTGEWAVITVGVETAQQGSRAGKQVNRVNDIEPVPDEVIDAGLPEVEDEGGGDNNF